MKIIQQPRAVVIGISTGGPAVLRRFFKRLDLTNGHIPYIVAQHMPDRMTGVLAMSLKQQLALPFQEARHGERVSGGFYILPGGVDTELTRNRGHVEFKQSSESDQSSRLYHPSIDALFESACDVFQGAVVGIIMTGMGHDGIKGALSLQERGGIVYAQNEDSCSIYGMPRAVIENGLANRVGTPESLADALRVHLGLTRSDPERGPRGTK